MAQYTPQERDLLLWAVVVALLVVLIVTPSPDECARRGSQEAAGPDPAMVSSFIVGDASNLAALFATGVLFQCSARYLLSSKVMCVAAA